MKLSFCLRLLAGVVLLGTSLRAQPVTFTLDPGRSVVTLSGVVAGAQILEQGPGSLTTTVGGSVMVEISGNELRFPGGSRVSPEESESWQPGPEGVEGSAPASYGGRAQIGSGLFSVSAVAATRRISFDVFSGVLPLEGENFNADGLLFQFVETNNPVLDYRLTGLINRRAGRVLAGLATNSVTGNSTLVTEGTAQILTLEVEATYVFELLNPEDSSLTLTGRLVATRVPTDAPPEITMDPVPPGATSMTLTWPEGFALEKAAQLVPPGWLDTGASSPAVIPFAGDGEYFRLVPR
ncbi:MAG: hypothetical protein KF791_13415 [Verrucomicrobiae bacterium]|nr:hypothetical protein [Verrucomicrobiae bacterium]